MAEPLPSVVPVSTTGGMEAIPVTRAAVSSQSVGDGRRVSPSDIQLVQNLIERCLQAYMREHEVVKALQAQAHIEPRFTTLVWQQLQRENREFFWAYQLRLELKDQIVLFNHLLEQQAQMVQKLQQRWLSAMASRPSAQFSGVTPLGAVPMAVNGQQLPVATQQQQPPLGQANGINPHVNNTTGVFTQTPGLVVDRVTSQPHECGPPQDHVLERRVTASSAPVNPMPNSIPGEESQGPFGSGSKALSSSLDLEFNPSFLGPCSSPDLALPGTPGEFTLSEGAIQGVGTGSANDLPSLVNTFSYPDLSPLDQVPPFVNSEGDGLAGPNMPDLPRIGSFSDFNPLDFES